MEAHDALEESTRHGRSRVGVAKGDEVSILGEAINHSLDDRLAMHLGKAIDEVHGDVCPHLRGNIKGL